jgi:UPF0716 protein FxsA
MGVFHYLLLLFFAVPLIEIYLLIKVGGVIGALPTVSLVVFTAVLGAWLVRLQGLSTLNRVRAVLLQGEVPAVEALEGVALLISGALLLTPGFFTDTLGFLLLVPAVRRGVILWMIKRHMIRMTGGRPPGPGPDRRGPTTLEGEFKRERD